MKGVAGVGVTVEVSNTELPKGNVPVTGALLAAFLITVAVAVVPALMVNGSQALVEPVKLVSPEVKTARKL